MLKRLVFCCCLGIGLFSLVGCQSGLRFNPWSEKDCYYSDYYQTPPSYISDRDYYHSDPVR